MLRRSFVMAMGALPASAWAQSAQTPLSDPEVLVLERDEIRQYRPENPLEELFIGASRNEAARPLFRRALMEAHLVLPLTTEDQDSAVRLARVWTRESNGESEYFTGRAVFTSIVRAVQIFGTEIPRITINGRAALSRFRQSNVIINPGFDPMLTLDRVSVAAFLEAPGESSAGPTQ